MSSWKECTLAEITSILGDGLHGTPNYDKNGEYFFINGNNLSNGKIIIKSDTKRADISEYTKYKKNLNDRTILVSINGTLGNIALYNNEKCILGKSACYFNVNDDVDKYFIKYVVTNKDFQEYIRNFATGTTIPNVSLKTMREYSFFLPPLEEQKAIAEVLSSLDDKIDLLHRQNQTLESLAQTLFRQWFIEEAKEEWEEIKLGDFVDCITGYSYKSNDLNDSKNALVTLKNFARDGSFRLDGFKEFIGTKYKDSQIVKHGDLVVSHTDITQEADIIGNPVLVVDMGKYDNLIITMDLMKVESKVDWLSKEFLYYLFRTEDFKFHCLGNSNGTTVLHMSRKTIPEYKTKIPNIEKIEEFTSDVKEILQKQYVNILQIQTLENLRDTLLPKLLSGEVKVK
ncbi:restriction endonuclease subunit S [Aliarcobacter butzleri]|uniref:restriction endonuclease subunit S n=1 Tax=Aliarcobacter butzleri TaxID=28197 RepID=UPI00125FA146|nr:restriction endonuclease subunit S [Aliarcobacter butzleri]